MAIDKLPSGRWRARWRETPGGPQLSATFARKEAAKDHLAAVRADLRRGNYVSPKAGEVLLRDYVDEHIARQPWRPATREGAGNALRHVTARLGDRSLSSIRLSDVQAVVSGLDLAPSTVGLVAKHLRGVLRAAVRDGLIVKDPTVGLRLPRADGGEVVPLSDAEVGRLYDAAPERFRAGVLLGAALGLRQGEASGLTVDRIDFLRRTVRVDRQWNERYGWGPPKTPGSNRSVPLGEPVVELLAAHLERFGAGEDGVLVHWSSSGREAGPMGARAWAHAMGATTRRAELVGTRFHDLRHHAASKLIAAGLSVVAVSRFLGHDNPRTTLSTYGHLWADDNDRIRVVMASSWSAESRTDHESAAG